MPWLAALLTFLLPGLLVAIVVRAIALGLAGYAGWAAWDVYHLATPRS